MKQPLRRRAPVRLMLRTLIGISYFLPLFRSVSPLSRLFLRSHRGGAYAPGHLPATVLNSTTVRLSVASICAAARVATQDSRQDALFRDGGTAVDQARRRGHQTIGNSRTGLPAQRGQIVRRAL